MSFSRAVRVKCRARPMAVPVIAAVFVDPPRVMMTYQDPSRVMGRALSSSFTCVSVFVLRQPLGLRWWLSARFGLDVG